MVTAATDSDGCGLDDGAMSRELIVLIEPMPC
jgi:hypothetical protein